MGCVSWPAYTPWRSAKDGFIFFGNRRKGYSLDVRCPLKGPILHLMDHFLYRFFFTFSEKNEENFSIRSLIFFFLHNAPRIPFFLALRTSVRWFQMPPEGLSFVKTLATFGIIYSTDPLLQLWEIWVRFASVDSPSIFLTISPCRPCWITCGVFFKITVVFHKLYLWNEVGEIVTLNFFCIFGTSYSLSHYSKNFKKKFIDWKFFTQTSLILDL